MTVHDLQTLIFILKIGILTIFLFNMIYGLIKKRKKFVIIGIIILMLSGLFYVKHDCTNFIVFNEEIMINNGNIYSSGICMLCDKFINLENGEIVN